jgi:hypothetical protein
MWFAYIHCSARDVFSMAPPRDYISSPVVKQECYPCGGGVRYLHRDPANVGGDEKEVSNLRQ